MPTESELVSRWDDSRVVDLSFCMLLLCKNEGIFADGTLHIQINDEYFLLQ